LWYGNGNDHFLVKPGQGVEFRVLSNRLWSLFLGIEPNAFEVFAPPPPMPMPMYLKRHSAGITTVTNRLQVAQCRSNSPHNRQLLSLTGLQRGEKRPPMPPPSQ
jgi:hypothetical protein